MGTAAASTRFNARGFRAIRPAEGRAYSAQAPLKSSFVANFEPRHTASDRFDGSRQFGTENQRQRLRDFAFADECVPMTDSCCAHSHQEFAWTRFRSRQAIDRDHTRWSESMDARGLHR